MADQCKVVCDRMALFSMTLNDPYPGFKVTLFFDAEYLRNGTRYRQFKWNTNKDLHTPYNDTKRRAVSLRQRSFLFALVALLVFRCNYMSIFCRFRDTTKAVQQIHNISKCQDVVDLLWDLQQVG